MGIETLTYDVFPQVDKVVVLGAGPSYNVNAPKIKEYITEHSPIIIGSNYNYPGIDSDYTMFIGKSIYSKSYKKIKSPNIIVTGHVFNNQKKNIQRDRKHDYFIMKTKATTKEHSYWNVDKIVFNKSRFKHWLSNCGYTALLAAAFFRPTEVSIIGFDGPTLDGSCVHHYHGDTRNNKGSVHSSPDIIAKKGRFLELIFDFLKLHGVKKISAFKNERLWGARRSSLCTM